MIRSLSRRSKEVELEKNQLLERVRDMEKERATLLGVLRERKMAGGGTDSTAAALEGSLKSWVYVSTSPQVESDYGR